MTHFIEKTIKRLKPFTKPFLVVFSIYCFSMIAIWRANFSFMDDAGRSVLGYAWLSDFFRFSASGLSYILNVSIGLSDISPLSQIFALALLAVSSILLTYILCDRKVKYTPLILSTFIGLAPFMMACWMFKFDAPSMAFSILVSIIPFLLWPSLDIASNRKQAISFGIVSVLCLLLMWTSYQASSGIYLVMLISLILKDIIDNMNIKTTLQKASFYSGIYIVSAILFKLFTIIITALAETIFNKKPSGGYRPTEIYDLSQLPSGIMTNLEKLMETISSSLNIEWKILILLVIVSFVTILFITSKRKGFHRLVDPCTGLVAVTLSIPASYGVYSILKDPPLNARSIMGIGLILAVVSVIIASKISQSWHKLLLVPSFVLLYSFIVFAFALGNGLADQQRYANFRNDALVSDLSRTFANDKHLTNNAIQIEGNIGMSPVMRHVDNEYPVIRTIFSDPTNMFGLGNGPWGTAKLRMYYNWDLTFFAPKDQRINCNEVPEVLDSYFHTIRSDRQKNTCIIIK